MLPPVRSEIPSRFGLESGIGLRIGTSYNSCMSGGFSLPIRLCFNYESLCKNLEKSSLSLWGRISQPQGYAHFESIPRDGKKPSSSCRACWSDRLITRRSHGLSTAGPAVSRGLTHSTPARLERDSSAVLCQSDDTSAETVSVLGFASRMDIITDALVNPKGSGVDRKWNCRWLRRSASKIGDKTSIAKV